VKTKSGKKKKVSEEGKFGQGRMTRVGQGTKGRTKPKSGKAGKRVNESSLRRTLKTVGLRKKKREKRLCTVLGQGLQEEQIGKTRQNLRGEKKKINENKTLKKKVTRGTRRYWVLNFQEKP